MRVRSWMGVLVVAFALVSVGCRAGGDGAGELRVFAAVSLTDAFTEAAKEFETGHPGTRLILNFGSSSALGTQIKEGAAADVFASASGVQTDALETAGRTEPGRVFATNSLVVVSGKQSGVGSFRDIARPGLRLVLAAKDVPAGQYARESLARASTADGYGTGFTAAVLANLKSEEVNVRAALVKVELGEADVAIVYATDARTAASVAVTPIPPEYNVVAEYPVALIKGASNMGVAREFVAFLLSKDGQAILERHGFGPAR